ncbi:MAG: WxL protein peptidoglycan domain-containing protein [Candidatus Dormibacteria bacterium]
MLTGFLTSLANVLAASPSSSPSAQPGANISVKPCAINPSNPLTKSYFILPLKPGATFKNCIYLRNNNTSPAPVSIGAADGLTAVTTGAVYSGAGQTLKKAGKWLTILSPNKVDLPPRQVIQVYFQVTVPTNATPGDHLAGIRIDSLPGNSTNGTVEVHILLSSIIAVLVVVPNTPSIHAEFNLGIKGVKIVPYTGIGTASATIYLEDTGLLYGRPLLTVTLKGPNGYAKTLSRQLGTMLPGDLIPYPFTWPTNLMAGTYQVNIKATWPGNAQGVSAKYTVKLGTNLQSTQPGKIVVVQPSTSLVASPFFWIALLAVLIVLGAAIFFILRIISNIKNRRTKGPPLSERLKGL